MTLDGDPAFRPSERLTSERMALPTTIGEQMPNARDVILKHIDALNGRDSDADPWAADAEFTAPAPRSAGATMSSVSSPCFRKRSRTCASR
jgi:hypothetical protein